MLRKKIAPFLACIVAFGLLLGAGCKKKKSETKGTEDKAAMTEMQPDMDQMAAMPDAMDDMGTAQAPPKGRKGALPIPAEGLFVHVNLKTARATDLYKKYEAKLKEMLQKAMAEEGLAKVLIEKCKLDPMKTIDEVMFNRPLADAKDEDNVAIIKGTFDTGKLMACVKPELAKQKLEVKDAEVAGKKGMTVKIKDKEMTVLALDDNSFVMSGGAMQAKVGEVLDGKIQSVVDSQFYKDHAEKLPAETVLAVLVPTVPASMGASVPMQIVKDIKSAALVLAMPGGGLDLKVSLDVGDPAKAGKLAQSLPMLAGLLKAKAPQLGETLAKNLKATAEKNWVKVALVLDKAAFTQLQDMIAGMVNSMVGVRKKGGIAPVQKKGKPIPVKEGKKGK